MGVLLWIIFGAIAGFVASKIMGGGGGIVWDVVVGIVGAVIGGFIMSLLGEGGINGFTLYSFVVAIFGACVFIWIMRIIHKREG